MGSSAKKKREKKKDFQKPKLKVGKARPKNTNATDTSFSARSINLKQQSLSEGGKPSEALFVHNLSLLNSKNDNQRRDALAFLTTMIAAAASVNDLPQPPSIVLAKAQPLILDGSAAVRSQFLKLLKALPENSTFSPDQTLLYTRAGMTHLAQDIRASSLDVLDWLVSVHGETLVSCAGGWIKTLRAFQNLLLWHGNGVSGSNPLVPSTNGSWTSVKTLTTASSAKIGNNKLLVHQLTSLSRFLDAGLKREASDVRAYAAEAAQAFPCCHRQAHSLQTKSNPFGYLNFFGTPRDVESEVYDAAEERSRIMSEIGLADAFGAGVVQVRKEGGEVGRAAALVAKALDLIEED